MDSNTTDYIIRKMTQEEVASIAIELATMEGWNPGLQDSEAFYAADPDGFLVGILNGEPIACISAVRYDDTFGFIGFYIVKKQYRGRGYGLKIWNVAMSRLEKCNIGLDGVVDQQANYRKSGFQLAYNNVRYEGVANYQMEKAPEIIEVSAVPFMDLVAYDKALFGTSRPTFLSQWVQMNQSASYVYFKDGAIRGFAVVRKCRVGYKIGPLFADSSEIAEHLFKGCLDFIAEGSSFFLDIPEVNSSAAALVAKYQMKPVFETARMYTQEAPDINIERIYGVTSFELG